MTKTQYYTATSADGFIADPDNSLDWLFEVDRSGPDRFTTFFGGVGAMCMGATTYEWVLGHDRLLERPDAWQAYYGDTPCWVFSHRDLPAIPGANLRFVSGDVGPVHTDMITAAGGANVWLVGGGELEPSRTRACSTRSSWGLPRSSSAAERRYCPAGCSRPRCAWPAWCRTARS